MMQPLLSKSLSIALASMGLAASLSAQKVWNANDGDWSIAGNWVGGVPNGTTSTQRSQFLINSSSSNSHITVTIGEGVEAKSGYIEVGLGKSVTLQLEDGASLTTGSLWGVGADLGEGTGAGHLTLKGPASGSATVTSGYFYVGRSNTSGGGNTLTISGQNLVVNDSSTSITAVGRYSNNNTLVVEDGATLNRYSLSLSPSNADAGRLGNGAIVRGPQSRLVLAGGALQVGSAATARDNYVRVEDHGTLEVTQQKAISIGIASNSGGNSLEVKTGGKVKTDGATTISSSSENGGDNGGANRLSILAGGTFASSSTITSSGLFQLEEGGILKGETLSGAPAALAVTITDEGRFEVEGEGLDASVTTTIQGGGTLAIGVTDAEEGRSTAASLTLASTVYFADDSFLEITLFGSAPTAIDKVLLAVNSSLELGNNVTLRLIFDQDFTPQVGDSWTLFEGFTDNINGSFSLDSLDPTLWDTSFFNQAGNWQLRAIPEPSSIAILAFTSAVFALHFAQRRQKKAH